MKIAVIGCGNLGKTIVNGLLNNGPVSPEEIIATKRNVGQLQEIASKGVNVTSDNIKALDFADLVIVALKPYNILEVLSELSDTIDPAKHTIVSLATGISLEQLDTVLPNGTSIFRAMPNTAADVASSLTCIAATNASDQNRKNVLEVFDCIGETVAIGEELMDAATVLGACGVAYVLRFMRAMIQGGIQIGFDSKTATKIVSQTMKGASELIIQQNKHPEDEIDRVTTPKGCTIAGLNEMEHNGFSSALIKGIVTSYNEI